MSEDLKQRVASLRERVAPVFERFPESAAAYVFGSVARGQARPDSDLDIGVVFAQRGQSAHQHYRRIGDLISRLEQVVPPRPVDLVVLEDQGPVFCHRVLLEGALLYESNRERRVDFESETYIRALDFLPTYELATRGGVSAFRRWLRTYKTRPG